MPRYFSNENPPLNEQEIFDASVLHVTQQRVPALKSRLNLDQKEKIPYCKIPYCVYLDEDTGRKCGIGGIIDPKDYDPCMEYKRVKSLRPFQNENINYFLQFAWMYPYFELLNDLQEAHDFPVFEKTTGKFIGINLVARWENIAESYTLDPSVIPDAKVFD